MPTWIQGARDCNVINADAHAGADPGTPIAVCSATIGCATPKCDSDITRAQRQCISCESDFKGLARHALLMEVVVVLVCGVLPGTLAR